ncbi:hypothetical protein RA11412_0784 [Rothia aeria]|uniref:Uncharacterized protein n=1 Tax=Rothia aeria TaxID=172042 RepID=A0A2Z5QXL3_9MICC|nr:hypothetical protein RA11412_0784 [Rothia aeria]
MVLALAGTAPAAIKTTVAAKRRADFMNATVAPRMLVN